MKIIKKYSFKLKSNELKLIKGGADSISTNPKLIKVTNTIVDDLNGLIR